MPQGYRPKAGMPGSVTLMQGEGGGPMDLSETAYTSLLTYIYSGKSLYILNE